MSLEICPKKNGIKFVFTRFYKFFWNIANAFRRIENLENLKQ